MRIVITGPPKSGKSALAGIIAPVLGFKVYATDTLIGDADWSQASEIVGVWFNIEGPWILEGVTVPRALRKWKLEHPGAPPPFERFIYIETPKVMLPKPGQRSMAKAIATVAEELRPWIEDKWVTLP